MEWDTGATEGVMGVSELPLMASHLPSLAHRLLH